MIFSTEINVFPKEGQYKEVTSYKDENGFEWKIAIIESGFFLAYFGDPYFKYDTFCLESEDSIKEIQINNTGCFYIDSTDFETFYLFRDMLKKGWTDTIWESIEELISERVFLTDQITKCEEIK